jgi:hypothetical protein
MEITVKSLLATGRVTPANIEEAFRALARQGGSMLRHLREAADFTDEDLCDVLAAASGLPRAHPADLAKATPEALRLVPVELCRLARALPLRLDWWGHLIVAMADPFDEAHCAELAFASGCDLRVELATEDAILAVLKYQPEDGLDEGEPYLYADDDLAELYVEACADDADILEVIDDADILEVTEIAPGAEPN